MWLGVVVEQQDTFRDESQSFQTNYLRNQPSTINDSIYDHSTCEKIDQQHILVVPKDILQLLSSRMELFWTSYEV